MILVLAFVAFATAGELQDRYARERGCGKLLSTYIIDKKNVWNGYVNKGTKYGKKEFEKKLIYDAH